MIIISFLFKSLSEYLNKRAEVEVSRPQKCPDARCGRQNCFWKHTGYNRRVWDGEEPILVRIQRFRCRWCGLVVSCLFSFLVAYRRHSARIITECIETYITAPVTVPLKSYRNIALEHSCGRVSVFCWTEFLAAKCDGLHYQLQKEFMLAGRCWQLLSVVSEEDTSPSAVRARSAEKSKRLNELFRLIGLSRIFFESAESLFEQLHAHFLRTIESPSLILTGRKIVQRAQQSMGCLRP